MSDQPPELEIDEGGWIVQRWAKSSRGKWILMKETFCKTESGYKRSLAAAKSWRRQCVVSYRASAGYNNISWDKIDG